MTVNPAAARGLAALLFGALLVGGMDAASAGVAAPDPALRAAATNVLPAQFYGYGYRPYYRARPYYYGPPRYGAAKQRYRTRRNFCNNQPSRC